MERSETLLQLLGTAHAHDEDSDVFVIYPSRLGFGSLAAPISGGDEAVASKLNLLMQLAWPADTLLQVSLYASPDLTRLTTSYKDQRRGATDPILRRITDEHAEFLREGAYQAIDPASGIRLRDTRVAITVQLPFQGPEPSEQALRQARELRLAFDQALKSAGISAAPIRPTDYIRLMETILNPGESAAWRQSPLTAYDPTELICTQILDPGSSVEVDAEGLWLNGSTRVRVLAPKSYPDMTYFGMAMRYLTDPETGSRGIRENVLVTLNVHIPDQYKTRGSLEKSHMWATHQAGTPLARFVREFRERKTSLEAILEPVKAGDAIVNAYLSVAIITHGHGSDEQSRRLTEDRSTSALINAQSYLREVGFNMMPERNMVLPFFAQLLPFAADASMRKVLERYKIMAGRHAVYLMPIMGQWRGTGTPLMTLFARDGQVQPVSPWDTDSNMNFIVAAQSGSGKSVFAQALTASLRSISARAWIVDVGDSYRNLAELLGGAYITFEAASGICINPFPLVEDFSEEIDMLAGVIAIMIAPKAGLDDFQGAALKDAMSAVWAVKGRDMLLDDVAQQLLRSERQEIRDMGLQMRSFTSDGEYGRYFNGPNTIGLGNQLTVLELGALKAKPHLQRVVLLTLMFQIGQAVYMGDRAQKSMLLIDEAWQLLASDETSDFIERAYRQFRKHNASVGVITQSVLDVWQTKGGRAIAENSASMYLLKQKGDAIDAVQRENRLPFGDWGYRTLKTVHTVQGQYSEIMCVTPFGMGVGRLVLSDFQKVLFSTKAEDVVELKSQRGGGQSLVDAINAMVVKRFGDKGRRKAA